jgi:hypothetical protein
MTIKIRYISLFAAVILFAGSYSVLADEINILHSDTKYFEFIFSPSFDKDKEINIDGQIFQLPVVKNSRIVTKSGEPVIQAFDYNIVIPNPTGFESKVIDIFNNEKNNYNLAPVQYLVNVDGTSAEEYKFYPEIYNNFKNKYSNKDFIEIKYAGIARNKYIANIKIFPYLYDNKIKKLVLLQHLKIRINFSGKETISSDNVDNFNYGSALNHNETLNWSVTQSSLYFGKHSDKLQGEKIAKMSEISNGNWIKIGVQQEGIYRIEASELQSLGINIPYNEVKTLKIFGKGGKPLDEAVSAAQNNNMYEQEIIVSTNSDGSLKNITFYGAPTNGFELYKNEIRRFNNYFSNTNYYLLTFGGKDGKRSVEMQIPDGNILQSPDKYVERVLFEEDIVNPYNPGAGRDWFGRTFFSAPFNPVMLHNLDRSGNVYYKFALAHRSASQGVFQVFDGDNKLGSVTLNATGDYTAAYRNFSNFVLPASKISSDDRSLINLKYINSDNSATAFFDYFEIHYPRSFYAINNSISFISDTSLIGKTDFVINGFTGNELFGFDVTNPKDPKLLKNNATTGGIFSIVTNLEQNTFRKFFVSSNLLKANLTKTEVSNLRDNKDNSDIVLITHPDLMESALEYKKYREENGFKVSVFRTDHIYNEFAAGLPDVTAIRDFIAYLHNNWTKMPEYVVLWGDGHFDYKNISTNKINYLPAYQTNEVDLNSFSDIENNYCTDDFFGMIFGDDLLADVKLGRVTIDSPELGNWIVEKIKMYENNSSLDQWRSNVILVADDGPTSNGSDGSKHTAQSEALQRDIIYKNAAEFQYDKIYLIEYPAENIPNGIRKPQVTEDLLTRINTTGGLMLNWVGHGNPRVWAHEQILERDITIPQMKNINKLFFLTAATCDFGRFDNPEVRSGAEEMFLSKVGGAIGVLSATRVVFSDQNAALNNDFYRLLLTRDPNTGKYPTLGDVMILLKQRRYDTNDQKYYLLGDPVLRLTIPDRRITIDSINGKNVAEIDSALKIKALSTLIISGNIISPDSNNIENDFNGTLTVTLRDGDRNYSIYEYDNGSPSYKFDFTKLGGALNRSSYKIENGRYTAEFIVPKDISFSDMNGRLFLYAYSNDLRYAKGTFNKFNVAGFEQSNINDTIGPDIKLFLDSRQFIGNDFVTSTPLFLADLSDDSGINTTGLGIGHKIEAWIDNSPYSIDLTDKFTTSLTDSKKGTVQNILYGLKAGEHSIKVRAWDVFNNYSVTETYFNIQEGGNGYFLGNLINYPDPFTDVTNISFKHNANVPFTANLKIYTINGQLIRNINQIIGTSHQSEIIWNGRDDNNLKAPGGAYMYVIFIPNDSNSETVESGIMMKIN